MPQQYSRRTLVKGIAWSTPVAVVATASPALAVSLDEDARAAIDEAFAQADARLRNPDGSCAQLEINFYQPAGAVDGTAVSVYVNVKNVGPHEFTASAANPLVLFVDSVRTDDRGGNRGYNARAETEGGVTYLLPESRPRLDGVADVPQGGIEQTFRWSVERAIAPDRERDMAIGFGSALSTGRRNTLVVHPPVLAPALDTIPIPQGCTDACEEYYAQKLAEWKTAGPVQWTVRGPHVGTVDIAAGTSVDSSVTGNYTGGLTEQSRNGIW